jgi:Sigma-70, region 4
VSAGRGGVALGEGADPAALYRRYERPLRTWLRGRVTAPPALVEDACASAWLILVAKQPVCGERIFGWLCTTALHEAYRLLRAERREQPSELGGERPAFVPPGRDDPETALEAKRALEALASLRERQRRYLAWQVGGYRYREIQELAGGATYTNVNKYLTRARARLRELADEASERHQPGSEEKGGPPMAIGSCRRCGLRPRRVRRGTVEPLCEECYREAMDKVARELAEEAATDGRTRSRRMKLVQGARPAERRPERVAPVARAGGHRPAPRDGEPRRRRREAPGSRTRCISEEVLREARRLYALGLTLRAVAETLLDQTTYANAHSAEVALRFQFKRRGWPLRSRKVQGARRAARPDDLARAA